AAHGRGVCDVAEPHVRVRVVRDAEAVLRRGTQLLWREMLELAVEQVVRLQHDRRIRADLVRLHTDLVREIDRVRRRLDHDGFVLFRPQTVPDDASRYARHSRPRTATTCRDISGSGGPNAPYRPRALRDNHGRK